jgi:hypothetical protein
MVLPEEIPAAAAMEPSLFGETNERKYRQDIG